MNTINIEGKEFTVEQLKNLIKNSENKNPMDEVYAYHNTTEDEFNKKHENNPDYLKAYDREVLIVAFYNKGDNVDFNNSKQKKFYGYFYMDKFRLSTVDDDYSNSNVPARLCFLREEDAKEAYTKFLNEIKKSRLT